MENKNQNWYEKTFSRWYPILYNHRDDMSAFAEIRDIVRIIDLSGNERVLDICCGNGRHMRALLQLNFDAYGMDLSEFLLDKAALHQQLSGRIIRADIRSIPFSKCYDVVFNLFSSFGYFLDTVENKRAMIEMVTALKEAGLFVLDHINQSQLKKHIIPVNCDTVSGIKREQRRQIVGSRIIKETTLTLPDKKQLKFTENVQMYYPEEIKNLMLDAGLRDIRFIGSYDGRSFKETSPRMIVIGKKI